MLRVLCQGYFQISNLHDTTNSTTEITEVAVQLPVTGNTCVWDSTHTDVGKWLHMLPSHLTIGEPQSFR